MRGRTYSGILDEDRSVIAEGGGRRAALLGSEAPGGEAVGWGGADVALTRLAKAILADCYGDHAKAARLANLFKWRALKELKRDASWMMTEAQVREVVDGIEQRQQAMAQPLRQMRAEGPQVLVGALGPDMGWSKNPELQPNIKRTKP